jgi:uncharacterized FlaG/YvyC family protein
MTKQQKLIAGFLASIIILGGFLMLLKGDEPANTPKTNPPVNNQETQKNDGSTKQENNNPSKSESQDEIETNSTVSNDSLDKDLASIDSQLKSLDTDTASIDQGLNDQPIEQGE